MRATTLPALALLAALATGACANDQQNQQPAPVAPAVGNATLGPNAVSGQTYSPNAGSISNGASGSSILQQEGGGLGIPR